MQLRCNSGATNSIARNLIPSAPSLTMSSRSMAKYGVTFPIFDKIEVNGTDTHEVYKYLRTNSELFDPSSNTAKRIPWNFAKFLVDAESGKVMHYYDPQTSPNAVMEHVLTKDKLE